MDVHLTRRALLAGSLVAPALVSRVSAAAPLVRHLSFVTRSPNLTHDAFMTALLNRADKVRTLSAALSGLVISEVLPRFNGAPAQVDTDAVIEIWTRDANEYHRFGHGGAGTDWMRGIQELVSRDTTYVAHEHLFIPPRERNHSARGLTLIVRKADWTADRFRSYWLGKHGPMAKSVPGLSGFVMTQIDGVRAVKGDLLLPECDGIAESWWDTPAGAPLGSLVPSEQVKAWHADGRLFIDRERSRSLSLMGHVILPVAV